MKECVSCQTSVVFYHTTVHETKERQSSHKYVYCCFFESEYNTTQIFEKASAVATQETSLGVRVCNRGSGSIILISEEDICLDEMLGCNTARSYTGLRMFEINLLTEHKRQHVQRNYEIMGTFIPNNVVLTFSIRNYFFLVLAHLLYKCE